MTLGLLMYLLKQPELDPLKKTLNMDADARILLFSTEGDTDPEMYRKIVWGIDEFGIGNSFDLGFGIADLTAKRTAHRA